MKSAFIKGIINPISGDYVENQIDLVFFAPEPLLVQRFYTSRYYGSVEKKPLMLDSVWGLNLGSRIKSQKSDLIHLYDSNGLIYEFDYPSDENSVPLLQSTLLFKNGFTNCTKGSISGRLNDKNMRLSHNEGTIKVTDGSGKVREFVDQQLRLELLPNGNKIIYEYDKQRLKKVKLLGSSGKKIASLNYSKCSRSEFDKTLRMTITANDHRKIEYRFKKWLGGIYLEEVIPSEGPSIFYRWEKVRNGARIVRKEYPENRFVEIEYEGEWDETGSSGRVKKIREPAGSNEKPVITYRFKYYMHPDKGITEVTDALGNVTNYVYDLEMRLTEISRLQGSAETLLKERLFWGAKNTKEYGNLISRSIQSGDELSQACYYFEYDHKGNIVKECLYGILTGKTEILPLLNENGKPKNEECECFQKEYIYSEDIYNLLIEEKDFRRRITYSYYPKTDLLQSQLIWDNQNKICLRFFYEYDNDGFLTTQVVDDGCTALQKDLTGLSRRYIKKFKCKTNQTPFGVPEEIEEKYLDLATGQEKLFHRIINEYNLQGRLISEFHYDSDNAFLYSLSWEYDSFGHVSAATDEFGHTARYKYDANGNLIYEHKNQNQFPLEYGYDYCNRLISCEEIRPEGKCFVYHLKYNLMSQNELWSDADGKEIAFLYDSLNRLISSISSDKEQQSKRFKYDVFNNVVMQIEGSETITESKFTIYGLPYQIKFKDAVIEKNEYSLDGLLIKSFNKDGGVNTYDYDYLSRLIKEESFSNTGEQISGVSRVYNSFHVISETDLQGNCKYYHYDATGKLEK